MPVKHNRGVGATEEDRFWSRVDRNAPDGCWIWTAGTLGGDFPYGVVRFRGRDTNTHRVAWELTRGLIPDGLVIDHLCRNPLCCNPDHLEPVSQRENVRRGTAPAAVNARKTHCDYGHELVEENIYRDRRGNRVCRHCLNRRRREWRARVRARGGKPS